MSELYSELKVRIEGIGPALMNNGQKADPTNKYAKWISKINASRKRGKALSEEAQEEMFLADFEGSLYLNEQGQPYWPTENVHAMLIAGAKKHKDGPFAKSAVQIGQTGPLEYDGPKEKQKMFKAEGCRDVRMVRVSGAPTLRCRPIFKNWAVEFTVQFMPDQVDPDRIMSWLRSASVLVGLSDFRPQYGKFKVTKFEEQPLGTGV